MSHTTHATLADLTASLPADQGCNAGREYVDLIIIPQLSLTYLYTVAIAFEGANAAVVARIDARLEVGIVEHNAADDSEKDKASM